MTAQAQRHFRQEAVVRLEAQLPFDGAAGDVGTALESAGEWLGEPVTDHDLPDGWRRFLVDMRLPIGDGRHLSFRKAAFVDLGPMTTSPDRAAAGISWYAAGLQPLFPVFAGVLRLSPGELHLEGCYAPPGGGLGVVADRLLLHVAARGTARWLLAQIAAASDGRRT